MKDLQSTRAMWLKGWLFLLIGLMSATILLIENWSWQHGTAAGFMRVGLLPCV
jgi:hypothetical protein